MTLPTLNWPEDGLIPVVIQDDESNSVLMMGFMNAEALAATQATGEVHFWSRSRQELWHKGASSGHVQKVHAIRVNCDLNSLLIRVKQIGAVCHDGYATCYYRDVQDDGSLSIRQDRLFDPRDVYGDGYGLENLTKLWWGAYTWLRDHDLSDVSGTSRMLREPEADVTCRIQDELTELSGVLDGTHIHTNQQEDAVLEGSQCLYWLVVASIKAGLTWQVVRPDRALDVVQPSLDASSASALLRTETVSMANVSAATLSHLFRMVAESVSTLDIDPRELIEHDLDELRNRRYLAEYFAR